MSGVRETRVIQRHFVQIHFFPKASVNSVSKASESVVNGVAALPNE